MGFDIQQGRYIAKKKEAAEKYFADMMINPAVMKGKILDRKNRH
jgi:hypothetical protein